MNFGVFEVARQADFKWAFLGLGVLIASCAIVSFFVLKDVRHA